MLANILNILLRLGCKLKKKKKKLDKEDLKFNLGLILCEIN